MMLTFVSLDLIRFNRLTSISLSLASEANFANSSSRDRAMFGVLALVKSSSETFF